MIIFKNIIGKTILLIIPIIILYTVLYYFGYLPILSDSISFDAKAYELRKLKLKQVDIIVVGSSIALNDLNSKIIKENFTQSYFNFGVWNLQIGDDYPLLKHYIIKYKPRYIILPITMHDFTSVPDASLPYNIDLGDQPLGYYYIKNFANLFEIIKRKNALDLSTKDNNRYDCLVYDNYGGVELHLTKESISAIRLKDFIGMFPNQNTPTAYKSLADIAVFLKKNKVKLISLQIPNSPSFVNTAQLQHNVDAHFLKCKAIVEDNGGVYLNYHDFFGAADTGMYVDPSHLSGAGSKVFTQKLVKDLKVYIQ